jgi:hypothetical protein
MATEFLERNSFMNKLITVLSYLQQQSRRHQLDSALLYIIGIAILAMGLNDASYAQRSINYNDQRLIEAINAVLTYLEGSFGALVMVCAGIGAILSAAFGQYKASLGLLVVAIGSFILRSLMSTFFNDVGVQP